MPGVGAVDKHLAIVVGFKQQEIAALEALFDQAGGQAQIGGHADAQTIAGKSKPDRIRGVVGKRKGVNAEIREVETRTGLKIVAGGQVAETVADGVMGGGAHVDREIKAPRQNADAANVIRMFVRDEDGS